DEAALAREHFARAVVEIKVNQGVDVFDFVAAHLAGLELRGGGESAGCPGGTTLLEQSLRAHVTRECGVRRKRLWRLRGRAQVIVMQLEAPAFMGLVLRRDGGGQRCRQDAAGATVAALTTLERGHGIVHFARGVVPAPNRRQTELHALCAV